MNAKYYDGKKAGSRNVNLHIGVTKLGMRAISTTAEDSFRDKWSYDSIIILETPKSGFAYVLGNTQQSDSRLELQNPNDFQKIKEHLPATSWKNHMKNHSSYSLFYIAIICITILIGLFTIIPKAAPYIEPLIPNEWQETLGEYVVASFNKDNQECNNPKGIIALNKMVTRLSKAAKLQQPLTVSVINDDEVNAFAAPGTNIVLLKGLITKAESSDEVAGVLAHEMGHVIEKHPMVGVIRVAGTTMLIQMMLGDIANFANIGIIANEIYQLKHSRQAEKEADSHSLNILKAANISPNGMAAFFERIQKEEKEAIEGLSKYMNPEILKMLSTHPESTSREQYFKQSKNTQTTPALSEKDWESLQKICEKTKQP